MWSWGVGRFKANKGRQSQLCLEIISVCFSVKVGTKESPSVISTRKSWKTVWLQLFDWNFSDFASKILLILLLSHKSCLPFSPHHPGLPAIKVDRKQVPRELGRRVPPPFLGSEGATCKWYNMSFRKTSSSNISWSVFCLHTFLLLHSVKSSLRYEYALLILYKIWQAQTCFAFSRSMILHDSSD